MLFSKTTYIVRFSDKAKGTVTLKGMLELARFQSNDLYTVEGLNGRELTEAELDAWEVESDKFWANELPRGLQ
jgi:hypothetical protein